MLRVGEEAFFTVLFNDNLWEEIRKYMFPNKKVSNFDNYRDGNAAAKHGYLTLFKQSTQLELTEETIAFAASSGNLKLVKYFVHNNILSCTPLAIEYAAAEGHVNIVKFFVKRMKGCYTVDAIKAAVTKGHLETVMFFHKNNGLASNYSFMKIAATNGHLDIVKFLYYVTGYNKNNNKAINAAIKNGHTQVVEFLHNNRLGKPSRSSLITACSKGNLDIIKILLERVKRGGMDITPLINISILYNQQLVLDYLLSN